MTIDEMKVVITADNSDVKKKIKDLNDSINEFQKDSSKNVKSSYFSEIQLMEKTNSQRQKNQEKFFAIQQRLSERQELMMQQLQERLALRNQLLENQTMSAREKRFERNVQMINQQEERNNLRDQQLSERTDLLKKQFEESSAIRKQQLLEKTYNKEQKLQEDINNKKQNLEEIYTLKKQKLQELLNLRQEKLQENLIFKQQKLEESLALKKQKLQEMLNLRQEKDAERLALKKQQLEEKGFLKKKIGSLSIENMIGIGSLAMIGAKIGQTIKKAITDSIGAIESESLFQVSFNKMADSMRVWSKEVSDSLGLNVTDLRRTTATVYEMVKSMGIGEQASINMAKGVSLLSQDMASFLHRNPEEIYHKITAGLMGQTRGLHLLGKAITEATIKEYAYAHGIAESGKRLTEQQKVVSRYLLLMEQTKIMQGNLAQTLNSPANQMRMFDANIKAFCQTLGNLFIPLLNAVLPILNAFVKAITMSIEAIGKFFGVPTNEEYAKKLHEGLNNVADDTKNINDKTSDYNKNLKDADKNIKKIQKSLAKFDEMNVLLDKTKKPKGTDGLDLAASGGKFNFPIPEYNWHKEWVNNQVNKIIEDWKKAFAGIDFTPFKNSLRNLQTAIKPILDDIGQGFQWLFDNFLKPVATWTIQDALPVFINMLAEGVKALGVIIEIAKPSLIWFYNTFLVPLGKIVGLAIIELLKLMTQRLKELSSWCQENSGTVELAFKIILSFLAGIFIYKTTKPVIDFLTNMTKSLKDIASGTDTFADACRKSNGAISTWFNTVGKGAMMTFALQAGMALIAWEIGILMANWDKMNGMERTIGVIGAVVTALGVLAISIGAVQSALTMGIAAAGIVAGISAVVYAVNSAKNRAENEFRKSIKMPEVKLPNIVLPSSLPKMATGGIVNRPTYAQIGENGAEAVVPLERNTGWIDMLASKLNGNGQPINLTVKIGEDNIISRVIDGINNKSVEMGRGMVMV